MPEPLDPFPPRGGRLHCEEVPLEAIARAVGTPAYVYSTGGMVAQARRLKAALAPFGDPLIAFAVKANPNAAVLATLFAEGLGADVVSGGEYARARAAGVDGGRILFSGVGKTEEEMRLAMAGGIFQLNLESVEEAETLSALASSMGREVDVAFRINPDVAAGSHAKISTGSAHNKFGIPIADAPAACARAASLPGLRVRGVAVHIGSQLTSLEPLEAAFVKVGALIAELRSAGHDIATSDLGGGLGIAYDPDLPPPPTIEEYGAMLRRVAWDWGTRLIVEPGRLIVGNAGLLLTRVVRIKPGPDCPFVIVDAGMNDLMRPTLYDAWHHIQAVEPNGRTMAADVVGPLCESGDSFAFSRAIDSVEPGDLMAIRSCGAYAATMANNYNSRPLTPEVLVKGGEWAVVRERQGIDALTRDERPAPWLGSAE
ncbi:MAG TPA: diaminopimelate decarboxylase [Allosphingosinicella sp.]|nr:diaminopimelate decarboxylase [Allosphingosinicella sp.]